MSYSRYVSAFYDYDKPRLHFMPISASAGDFLIDSVSYLRIKIIKISTTQED